MLELGVIAGGCRLDGDKINLPEPKTPEPKSTAAEPVEAKSVQRSDKK